MRSCSLSFEATDCRLLAREFFGLPEEVLLRRIAQEFDRLAAHSDLPAALEEEDVAYFGERAHQEMRAAVRAKNAKARLAHLKLAQRYDRLSQAASMQASRAT